MAYAAQHTHGPTRTLRDGAVRCELCGHPDHHHGHDWCPAVGTLVCNGCCEDLLRGEPHRLFAAAQTAADPVTPLEIVAACTACDRLSRMLVDDDEILPVTSEEEPGSIH